MNAGLDILRDLVAAELAEPVDPRVGAMAAAIAALYPGAARAVLFYGSCLRTADLDGQMLDFYLIVSSYDAAYGKGWLARANRLVPPNVFPFEHQGLVAKYAVLSEADFDRLNGPDSLSVSVWARFAQPSRLAWAAKGGAAHAVTAAIARAAPTLLGEAVPVMGGGTVEPLMLWRRAFALTYSAELRAERRTRAASVVEADPERYRRFTGPAVEAAGIGSLRDTELSLKPVGAGSRRRAERLWAKRRRAGKALSVLRLAKASFTFAGGADYLAWKINRHAGTDIVLKPWQRRWPLLGAVTLLPRLLKRGAIR
ncbi:hypothetical protein [Allosphingosinicella sp.]|uniref:hypothetical protein n=1 Tax=Allosphingosinicella sp. TaxID=2823234 RepID=UPI002FC0BBA8